MKFVHEPGNFLMIEKVAKFKRELFSFKGHTQKDMELMDDVHVKLKQIDVSKNPENLQYANTKLREIYIEVLRFIFQTEFDGDTIDLSPKSFQIVNNNNQYRKFIDGLCMASLEYFLRDINDILIDIPVDHLKCEYIVLKMCHKNGHTIEYNFKCLLAFIFMGIKTGYGIPMRLRQDGNTMETTAFLKFEGEKDFLTMGELAKAHTKNKEDMERIAVAGKEPKQERYITYMSLLTPEFLTTSYKIMKKEMIAAAKKEKEEKRYKEAQDKIQRKKKEAEEYRARKEWEASKKELEEEDLISDFFDNLPKASDLIGDDTKITPATPEEIEAFHNNEPIKVDKPKKKTSRPRKKKDAQPTEVKDSDGNLIFKDTSKSTKYRRKKSLADQVDSLIDD